MSPHSMDPTNKVHSRCGSNQKQEDEKYGELETNESYKGFSHKFEFCHICISN